MTFRHVVSIHGVPRSGTSWLGQIFNQHSDVLYRFQPFFSYRFRGRIGPESSAEDIQTFLNELYAVQDDDFIAGNWPRPENASIPLQRALEKQSQPGTMVMKEVRYHYLIEKLLQAVPDIKIVGIVRHPCAVISSWLKNPKEFKAEWDPMVEWRQAPSKNQGRPEEYFGYEKWKEITLAFLVLEITRPENFILVQYEQMVQNAIETIRPVFAFAGLDMEKQVMEFIQASQNHHLEDAYAVYKSPSVKDNWRSELDPRISAEIFEDIQGTALERFLA